MGLLFLWEIARASDTCVVGLSNRNPADIPETANASADVSGEDVNQTRFRRSRSSLNVRVANVGLMLSYVPQLLGLGRRSHGAVSRFPGRKVGRSTEETVKG